MTIDRSYLLIEFMHWYWVIGNKHSLISKSDFEFIYNIWNNGLVYYDPKVRERLNTIREVYLNSIESGMYELEIKNILKTIDANFLK